MIYDRKLQGLGPVESLICFLFQHTYIGVPPQDFQLSAKIVFHKIDAVIHERYLDRNCLAVRINHGNLWLYIILENFSPFVISLPRYWMLFASTLCHVLNPYPGFQKVSRFYAFLKLC